MKKINMFFIVAAVLSYNAQAQVNPLLAWNEAYSSLPIGAEYIDYDSLSPISFGYALHKCGSTGSLGGADALLTRGNGGYMVGIHVIKNQFLCSKSAPSFLQGFTDYDTGRNGMHACPLGSSIIGIHVNNNVLYCAYPVGGRQLLMATERAGQWGARAGMHACPSGSVMTGIHVNNNVLMCTQTSGPGAWPLDGNARPLESGGSGGSGGGGTGGGGGIKQR